MHEVFAYLDIPDSGTRDRSSRLGQQLHRFEVYLRLKSNRIVELPQLATQTAFARDLLLSDNHRPSVIGPCIVALGPNRWLHFTWQEEVHSQLKRVLVEGKIGAWTMILQTPCCPQGNTTDHPGTLAC